ncbi:hypothetical protein AB0B50_40170 [Streptomyces sp. NPDC041068]|uniref:hypothetical protein n=1 Tax=Streptomyces sp. NPDC041068 TaxID=3155130 RepID=UPI0033D32DE1
MDTTAPHPDAVDQEDQEPVRLSSADLHQLGNSLAAELDDWEATTDYVPNGSEGLHLAGPDGRAIGLRLLFDGRALQTFAIGGAPPATTATETVATPLAEGVRYSTGVTFTHEQSPLEAALTAIRTVLLPAFDGHRAALTSRGRCRGKDSAATPEQAPTPAEPATAPPKARTLKSTAKAKTAPKSGARKAPAKPKDTKSPRRASKKSVTSRD